MLDVFLLDVVDIYCQSIYISFIGNEANSHKEVNMYKYSIIIDDKYKFFVEALNSNEASQKIDHIEPTLSHLVKDVKLVQRIVGE